MEQQIIDIEELYNNEGQIPGLPKNPRVIKDHRFERLKKSIQDDPEMMQLRELIVIETLLGYVVIAGNQRLAACRDLGYKEMVCKVLPPDTPVDKLKAITIKDNVSFGEHDFEALANEWDKADLKDWGIDVPKWDTADLVEKEEKEIDTTAQWFINIRCNDEAHAQELYERFIEDGLDVKIVT